MLSNKFWTIVHGGSTHFPIGLLIASVVFDFVGYFLNREKITRDLYAASYYCVILGALGSFVAVLSGLLLTNWQTMGNGPLFKHHEFVWPAFGVIVGLAVWRIIVGEKASRPAFGVYLAVACIGAVLMAAAGYWGGELR